MLSILLASTLTFANPTYPSACEFSDCNWRPHVRRRSINLDLNQMADGVLKPHSIGHLAILKNLCINKFVQSQGDVNWRRRTSVARTRQSEDIYKQEIARDTARRHKISRFKFDDSVFVASKNDFYRRPSGKALFVGHWIVKAKRTQNSSKGRNNTGFKAGYFGVQVSFSGKGGRNKTAGKKIGERNVVYPSLTGDDIVGDRGFTHGISFFSGGSNPLAVTTDDDPRRAQIATTEVAAHCPHKSSANAAPITIRNMRFP